MQLKGLGLALEARLTYKNAPINGITGRDGS